MNPLLEVRRFGQQIWLDNLSRTLINDGHLERLIRDDGIAGITTNPAIFQKAISAGMYYAEELAELKRRPMDAESRYERLAISDVQRACDLLRAEFERSEGEAGYVSLEVSPALAHDADGTIASAHRLRAAVDRPNLLIKVPATAAGVVALEGLIAAGVSVNVTLMFSLAHVDAVASAYRRGLYALVGRGGDARKVKSVASLFLSRVDSHVDARLEALGDTGRALCGKAAVALAKLAYQRYHQHFHSPAFAPLLAAGGRPQQMLWASTGTKNPAYSDLLYVEPLIGPETVNTLPEATLDALRDHGQVASTLADGVVDAQRTCAHLADLGIELVEIGEQLQREGLAQFEEAFRKLLAETA